MVNTGTLAGGAGGGGGAAGYPGAVAGANGANGDGVYLKAGGTVINGGGYYGGSGSVISGAIGVYAAAGAATTVTNYGTIAGDTLAVAFASGSTSDRLIVEAGATFVGGVYGGGGTLELASGTATIAGIGSTFNDFATYQLDAGGSWTFSGANTIAAAHTLVNDGTLVISAASSLTLTGILINNGQIDVGGVVGSYAGLVFSGNHTLSGGGVVSLSAAGYIGGSGGLTNLDNTIDGGGFIKGVTLTNDGVIDNDAGRMIINTGGTVTNDGLIRSTATGNLLIRDTTIDSSGGGTVIDAHRIQLSNATLAGGVLTIGAGALLINDGLGGTINLSGGIVHNFGMIEAAAGGLTIDGDVLNNGLIEALTGTLDVKGAVTGSGTARLWGKGVLEIDGALSENVFFAKNSTGTLVLGDITSTTNGVTGRIYGLSTSGANHIDLSNLTFAVGDTAKFTGGAQGGTLTIFNSANEAQASIEISGHYLGSTFTVKGDGSGGTLITDPAKTTAQLSQAMAAFESGGGSGAGTTATAHSAPPNLFAAPHG